LEAVGTALMIIAAILGMCIIFAPTILKLRGASKVQAIGSYSPSSSEVDRRSSEAAADQHYAQLVLSLGAATQSGDHAAVAEITSNIARVASQRDAGKCTY
jgi:hypothetical protein